MKLNLLHNLPSGIPVPKVVQALKLTATQIIDAAKFSAEETQQAYDQLADHFCVLAGDGPVDDAPPVQQWQISAEDEIVLIQALDDEPVIFVNGKGYTPDEALELSSKLIRMRNLATPSSFQNKSGAVIDGPSINTIDDIPDSFTAPVTDAGLGLSAASSSVVSTGDIIKETLTAVQEHFAKIHKVLTNELIPDGIDSAQCVSDLLKITDGSAQRAIDSQIKFAKNALLKTMSAEQINNPMLSVAAPPIQEPIGWVNRHENGNYGGVYKSPEHAEKAANGLANTEVGIPVYLHPALPETMTIGIGGVIERIYELVDQRLFGFQLQALKSVCNRIVELPKSDPSPLGWGNILSVDKGGQIDLKVDYSSLKLSKERALSFASTMIYLATSR